jgi:hypothetical protein
MKLQGECYKMRELFRSKEPLDIVVAGTKPMTLIRLAEDGVWEVIYKGVLFAELNDLKEAHDRLQKLLALDTTK